MTNFVKQFYDKWSGYVLAGLLLTHIVAALTQGTVWDWLPLLAISIATAILSYRRLEWGLAVAFLEIFVGGHGHLINVDVYGFSLSIREVLFSVVMGSWLIQMLQRRVKLRFILHRDLPFAVICCAVLLGSIHGFISNDPTAAFDDMNGYLTLAYILPMISLAWTGEQKRLLLQTLSVSAVWIALTTLVYVYAFTHLPGLASHELYLFVRDARLAEVTLQTSGQIIDLLGNSPWYFRVFEQSQIITVAFELLLITATLFLWREAQEKIPKALWFVHVILIATVLASLSRSFWIGSVAAIGAIGLALLLTRPRVATLVKRHLQLGLVSLIACVTLFILVVIPVPPRPDLSDSSFYRGRDEGTREVAVSSRWNLLGPMIDEIWDNPIIGSGFGETVTFISDDPRLRAIDPSGEVTAYRFEWGYHDLWLKMGLLGLFGFVWLFVTIITVALESVQRRDDQYWLVVGLAAGVILMYTTHLFSPYLNHPIGLAFLVFIMPFFPWENKTSPESEAAVKIEKIALKIPGQGVGVAFKQ